MSKIMKNCIVLEDLKKQVLFCQYYIKHGFYKIAKLKKVLKYLLLKYHNLNKDSRPF